jgi:hypothetical protein
VSIRLELDNGKAKEYPTWWTEYSSEGYSPEKPYHTKCGLSFKKDLKDSACGHLECAIYAAKEEAILPVAMYFLFSTMMIVAGWYKYGDLLAGILESEGFLIIFDIICILMAISPARR